MGDPWGMWTAEQARQYVAEVARVPADDLQRLYLPGKSQSYCFLHDKTDTTHVTHFRPGLDEPLVVMCQLREPASGWFDGRFSRGA